MIKPRTPSGTLELLPAEQIAFNRMLDVIRSTYERFGFLPVHTPTYELSDVLLTKTGGETERQVYFVQSTGALEKSQQAVADGDAAQAPELALRFDLTVPLARYVAEHQNELAFPFRRYQIQQVFRGERPQRGRYREFYQCDIDIIGRDDLSVRHDAECPAVMHAVFTDLAIGGFTIQINNRRLMRGFLTGIGIADGEAQANVLREVDKLDKRGVDWLKDRLTGPDYELPAAAVDRLVAFVSTRSTSHQDALARLAELEETEPASAELASGIDELREVLRMLAAMGVPESDYAVNFAIARGLDYYTGTVYETTLDDHPELGSICSGGRYDDLAGQYTKSRLPGVGMSIGLTRLFWQLREAGLVESASSTVQVLVPHLGDDLLDDAAAVAADLRNGGINTETVLDGGKLAKQMKYADRAGIRFVAIVGANEVEAGTVTVRDLRRQDQFTVPRGELVRALRVELAQPEV